MSEPITDNLRAVRTAHSTRLRGGTWQEVADTCGCSLPTARKLVARYHEHRKAGTLFADQQDTRAEEYTHPVLTKAAQVAKSRGAKA